MFEKLKGLFGSAKPDNAVSILTPVAGEAVSLKEVPDPTFSEEMLGKGAAVIPTDGRVVSPVNGKVLGIFRTCHAVTLQSEDGAEILIHIGLDTVKLAGEHFTPHVKKGDAIKAGDLLIEMNLAAVKAAGYNTITPVVICNPGDYASVEGARGPVRQGDTLITLRK